MSAGGVNVVEFSSVKRKIKRSNRHVVQGGRSLDRQQWTLCVVSFKICSGSLNQPAIMCLIHSSWGAVNSAITVLPHLLATD